ncbi:Trm112 family protein [Actinomadura hibisca]|uniref:Trm112 family protein n=1 Tax=Actinomadura hibisca TaxID=68565 RepID=UPI00082CE7AC|nr:Trm112 family protein [Actinomadura hibisca]
MTVKLDSWLLEILACPNCGGDLRPADDADELACVGTCHYVYAVRDDIPVLLVDEARAPAP